MKRLFYTDGSYGAQGVAAGGWAVVEVVGTKVVRQLCGAHPLQTTSTEMELKAVVEALKVASQGEEVTIHCDDQHVVDGITTWLHGWQANDWCTPDNTPIAHASLWQEVWSAMQNKKVSCMWIRSHSGQAYNELANKLAAQAYLGMEAPVSPQSILPGTIFHLGQPQKKYVMVLDNIRIDGKNGFLAKMLAHCHGNEMVFVSYDQSISIVDASIKESHAATSSLKLLAQHSEKNLYQWLTSCRHVVKKAKDTAQCAKCSSRLGWWCKESPDNKCHYFTENGQVTLLNGNKFPVAHSSTQESDDWCLFCGLPEERL